MEIKQQLRLSQQLVMTPQLQQAIRLLQLSRLELIDEVRKELDNNPVLTEEEEGGGRSMDKSDGQTMRTASDDAAFERALTEDARQSEKVTREVDWEKFLENRRLQQPVPGGRGGFEELPPIEANLTKPSNLQDHLLWQLQMSGFTDVERRFAELV